MDSENSGASKQPPLTSPIVNTNHLDLLIWSFVNASEYLCQVLFTFYFYLNFFLAEKEKKKKKKKIHLYWRDDS